MRHGPRIVFDMPIRFHLKTLLDDYLASVVQDGAALGSAEMGPPTTGFTTSNLKWELAPGSHAIEWVQADEFKMCLRYSIGLSQFRKPLAGTTELATRTGHPHRPPAPVLAAETAQMILHHKRTGRCPGTSLLRIANLGLGLHR